MSASEALIETAVLQRLGELSGWSLKNGKLHKIIVFNSFSQAFAFMTEAALYSERKNHHPEWINVYKTVEIFLRTHDADGITEKDFAWAVMADSILALK